MAEFARPPRGWLYGVLLTIFTFWYSGVLWQAFQEGERRWRIAGGVVMLVATGLTAYDAQRLKQMALSLPEGQVASYAIVGALSLYLDFINLFLMLLRFTGRRD